MDEAYRSLLAERYHAPARTAATRPASQGGADTPEVQQARRDALVAALKGGSKPDLQMLHRSTSV
jgi:hypothetical protein